VKILVIATVKS